MLIPEVDWDLCQECDNCQAQKVCNARALVQIDPGNRFILITDAATGVLYVLMRAAAQRLPW